MYSMTQTLYKQSQIYYVDIHIDLYEKIKFSGVLDICRVFLDNGMTVVLFLLLFCIFQTITESMCNFYNLIKL